MSFRYASGVNKPGYNPLVPGTPIYAYNLFSWGQNTTGQLGNQNTTNQSSPNQVGSLTNWLVLTGGYNSSFALKTDGTMWAWGNNAAGQLGQGNTTNRSSPVQIGALTIWASIGSAFRTNFGVTTSGALWVWGSGAQGRTGLGNTTYYSSPKQVGSLTNWLRISSGSYGHVLAVKTDGTLWAWGYNNNGQLGLGDTVNRSSPVQVGALSNWANVSAGQNDWSIAVKTDGTLWTWGSNVVGQLGLGNRTYYSSPKQVGALTAWLLPSAGYRHALVTKTNGTLWAWGEGNYGQLGNNSINQINTSPLQVGALTNWSIASAAVNFSLAVKTDGTLWSWGQNSVGQLGQNTVGAGTYKSSPTQVGSSTTWYSVSATYVSGLALG